MTPAPISVERLRELLAFLDGSGQLDGRSFGDDGPIINGIRRNYWWRADLRHIATLLHQLAERDAEVEMLRGVIAWVGEVYPATDAEADGAHMTVTWAQFNAMREAVGLKPAKAATQAKNKSLIVRADHLRSLEAAERSREEFAHVAPLLLDLATPHECDTLSHDEVSDLRKLAAFLAASGGKV